MNEEKNIIRNIADNTYDLRILKTILNRHQLNYLYYFFVDRYVFELFPFVI